MRITARTHQKIKKRSIISCALWGANFFLLFKRYSCKWGCKLGWHQAVAARLIIITWATLSRRRAAWRPRKRSFWLSWRLEHIHSLHILHTWASLQSVLVNGDEINGVPPTWITFEMWSVNTRYWFVSFCSGELGLHGLDSGVCTG